MYVLVYVVLRVVYVAYDDVVGGCHLMFVFCVETPRPTEIQTERPSEGPPTGTRKF